ncbi:MAG: CoA-binding protein [Bryobacteraceae bacterium]|nr:CoA-binding protein [Bryobacteraceae bacterium]MDW8378604.1 CoA-binding protein [Bryobacterales bacterium]
MTIADVLKATKTIAVVGLSNRKFRASHGVARYLQQQGYRIIPVNPNESTVLGEKCYASLVEIPEPIDLVNIFRRPEFVPPLVEEAIQIGARAIWMQEGVIHEEAAARARQAGLFVVMDKCILKEHQALVYG